jgi:hypothetical protein
MGERGRTVTGQKDLKRLIRARMARTGESYTTARLHILRRKTTAPAIRPRRHAPPTVRLRAAAIGRAGRIPSRTERIGYLAGSRLRPAGMDWLSITLATPAILIFLLVALLGCSSPAAMESVMVRDSAGVEIVENVAGSMKSDQERRFRHRLSRPPIVPVSTSSVRGPGSPAPPPLLAAAGSPLRSHPRFARIVADMGLPPP